MTSAPAPRNRLRTLLLALIGVGLLGIGAAGAVALGWGTRPLPGENSVDAGFARDARCQARRSTWSSCG